MEKGDFVNNLRKTASFVVVEVNVSSISLAISTNLRAGTIDDQEIRELSLLKLIKQTVPIGTIFAYASDAVPEGFLVCDGSPLKANDYPELYEVLSTIHGNGIDSNSVLTGNFNLPDYRGMFLRGWDPIGINDPDFNTRQSPRSGANEGNRVGSIQNHHVQAHDHLLNLPRHINIGGRYSGGDWSLAWESHDQFLNNPPQRVGENGGKETRPKNAAVNFIIKVL
ncbi:phage tail protein [Dyadobacter sp. NIV53]|uniref:phage tail protein n=1 Tax=Dyadobacter sp. NIV53 TaxID=2861765 RepID=UPI001C87BFC3|nr:phage tail protein [Dyadobacter sp. NIV53]